MNCPAVNVAIAKNVLIAKHNYSEDQKRLTFYHLIL